MRVIAHRGASAERPENTLAAFVRALEVGADMIEMDLRASAEGVIYVAHDPALDGRRRPSVLGPPPPLPWSEIRARAGPEGRYPSLDDVLDALAGKVELNLEVKERRVVPLLVRELHRRGLDEGVLLSSFDRRAVRQARALAPRLPIALLAVRMPLRLAAAIAASGARALHPRRLATTPRLVRLAHAAGVPVNVWTVDDPADMRLLASWGVDGIFTNDPKTAVEVVRGTAAR